jgi:hypothetical protein
MKLAGYTIEEIFEIILSEPSLISSLTFNDAEELDSFIIKLKSYLDNNNKCNEFIEKYNLGLELEDHKNIIRSIQKKLDEISDLIQKKCAGTYTLYGFEELEMSGMPIFPEGTKFTQIQIVLFYYYLIASGEKYPQPNWNQVADRFGYKSINSGIKLYHIYCKVLKKTHRINYPSSKKNIEKIIPCLTHFPQGKVLAERELEEAKEYRMKKLKNQSDKDF